MRIKFLYLVGSCFTLIFLSNVSYSKGDLVSLKHFQPGKYKLIKGHEGYCDEGAFAVKDSFIHLGTRHSFFRKNNKDNTVSNLPGDEGCVTDVEDTVRVMSESTELKFKSTHMCSEKIEYVLEKNATLKGNEITMKVKKTGVGGLEYSCVWQKTS